MCRITVIPIRHKPQKSSLLNEPADHIRAMPGRTSSDPKPMLASEPQSSSLPSGVYVHRASTDLSNSPLPNVNSVTNEFVDHYAILNLDCWATSEEIKASYRTLRAQFFSTDPYKYRALQAAFDILVDRQARVEYDKVYRTRIGLPPPVETWSLSTKDGSHSSGSDGDPLPLNVEVEVELKRDPNKALKTFVWGRYRCLIGSVPYQSWVPMREGYRGRGMHERLMCSRPKYILVMARNARAA